MLPHNFRRILCLLEDPLRGEGVCRGRDPCRKPSVGPKGDSTHTFTLIHFLPLQCGVRLIGIQSQNLVSPPPPSPPSYKRTFEKNYKTLPQCK